MGGGQTNFSFHINEAAGLRTPPSFLFPSALGMVALIPSANAVTSAPDSTGDTFTFVITLNVWIFNSDQFYVYPGWRIGRALRAHSRTRRTA
jgi:hypothetical protein